MNATPFLPPEEQVLCEVRHACIVRAPRLACYQALTTPEGWNAWFTASMFLELHPGGAIIFEWKDWGAGSFSGGDHGIILSVDEGVGFEYSWHPDDPGYSTRVRLALEDHPDGCLLRVLETGFRNDELGLHAMAQSAAGWGEALTLFKFHMEHGLRY